MLSRKISFLLNTVVISLLMSGSHTTLAKVSDRETPVTEAQKAADAAREARMAEMKAGIGKRTAGETTAEAKTAPEPMKEPTEISQVAEKKTEETPKAEVKEQKSTTPPAHAMHSKAPPHPAAEKKPVHKPRTLQEQIALNKQKKAEELHKVQETHKAAGGHVKPLTWQERAKLAREKREAAMAEKPVPKEGVEAHTKPPVKEEPAKTVEKAPAKPTETAHPTINLAPPSLKMTTGEHEHIVTTLPMPEKGVHKPAEKPSAIPEAKTGDETRLPAMSLTQKKMMEKMDVEETKKPSVAPKMEPTATPEANTGDEPMKKSLTPPPAPKGGPKPIAMNPTQKKMMEKMDAKEAKKPALAFEEELKQRTEKRAQMTDEAKAATVQAIPEAKPNDNRPAFLKEIEERAGKPGRKAKASVDSFEE
jgi:hypothetical protein